MSFELIPAFLYADCVIFCFWYALFPEMYYIRLDILLRTPRAMNFLQSTLVFLSTFFLFVDTRAAAHATMRPKPSVGEFVKNIHRNRPSGSVNILLQEALNDVDVTRVEYHATVKALNEKRKARTDSRVILLAARAHIPVEALPTVVRLKDLHYHHTLNVTLICEDAGLPFTTLDEYYEIGKKINATHDLINVFAEGKIEDSDQWENNLVVFIEFLIAVCPNNQLQLKGILEKCIQGDVQQELDSSSYPVVDYISEIQTSSDEDESDDEDEEDAAESIRREAAQS
jgi:hypothetical protein